MRARSLPLGAIALAVVLAGALLLWAADVAIDQLVTLPLQVIELVINLIAAPFRS